MQTLYGDINCLPDTPGLRSTFEAKTLHDLIRRELVMFKIAGHVEGYDGPGRFHHCRILCDCLWRQKGQEVFRWHPWLETILEEYCADAREVTVTGPGTGGKTMGAAMFLLLQWYCSPVDTGALICSTTRDGLKRRLWGEMFKLYNALVRVVGKVGRMIPSDLAIHTEVINEATGQLVPDPINGIFGLAVACGEELKAMGRIIGFHPRRIFVAADELTDITWAIIDALTNLFRAKQKAQFFGMGNASLPFDSHGRMMEPAEGWNSITVDSERWITKRGSVGIHINGFKSPNVLAQKKIFDFLVSQEDIDDVEKKYGSNSPQMWRQIYGFWCPEGTTKTVLNHSLILRFLAMQKAAWNVKGERILWAALDPAFEGGDRCVLRFGWTGKSDTNIDTLEFAHREDGAPDIVLIKTDAGSKEPLHYQIARQVKEECEKRGVDPAHFAMDTTGEGGGLASIIANEWGAGFLQVEFGGKPSDLPVSEVNSKPCKDEYKNKVTELWYSFRAILMLGQIRGLDAETAVEFCNRLYIVESKTVVESKRDMKARNNQRSPDLADCSVCLLFLVRMRGALGKALSRVGEARALDWKRLSEEYESQEALFETDPFEAVI